MTHTIHPWTKADAEGSPIPELPEGSMVVVALKPNNVDSVHWHHRNGFSPVVGYILPEPPSRPAKPPVPKPGDVIEEGTLLFDGKPMAVVGVGRSFYPIKIEYQWNNGDWASDALAAYQWRARVTYATPPEPVRGEVVLWGCKLADQWHVNRHKSPSDTHCITLPLDANGDLPEGNVTCKIERIVK